MPEVGVAASVDTRFWGWVSLEEKFGTSRKEIGGEPDPASSHQASLGPFNYHPPRVTTV